MNTVPEYNNGQRHRERTILTANQQKLALLTKKYQEYDIAVVCKQIANNQLAFWLGLLRLGHCLPTRLSPLEQILIMFW